MKELVGFDGIEGGFESEALMDAEPLAGMAVPLDIEAVATGPINTGEGGVEFLAEVIGEARAITL
jgi:hypothetical protein